MATIKAKKVILKNRDGEHLVPVTAGIGYKMFDPVLQDHVLGFYESRGLLPQGTYAYKTAVAGERFGYPTFYNKCVEEFQDIRNTKQWLKSNVTEIGSVVDNQGVLSGFSASNYTQLPFVNNTTANTAEFVTKVKITDFHGTYNDILKPATTNCPFGFNSAGKLGVYSTSSWLLGSTVYPTNTYIWVRVVWDGASYKVYGLLDNSYTISTLPSISSWSLETTWTTTTNIWTQQLYLGNSNNTTSEYFNGTIDLNESYINLNDSRWWSGVETVTRNPNGHVFYDINDKSIIDEYYSANGRAWFYGVDTENERIFLPRNSKYFRIGDTDTVGINQDAGLPNITGGDVYFPRNEDQSRGADGTGALYSKFLKGNTWDYSMGFGGDDEYDLMSVNMDASRSNKIYGKSNTVEVDSVNMLLYICVGNTESDIAWIDVVNQVKNGVQDLEDKRIECIESIQAAGSGQGKIEKHRLTDCVLEVPQRVQYEIIDANNIIIHRGTRCTIPYGTEDLSQERIAGIPRGDNYWYKTYSSDLGFTLWISQITNFLGNAVVEVQTYIDQDNSGLSPDNFVVSNMQIYAPEGVTGDMVLGDDFQTFKIVGFPSDLHITKSTKIYDMATGQYVPNNKGEVIPALKISDYFLGAPMKIVDLEYVKNCFYVHCELEHALTHYSTATLSDLSTVLRIDTGAENPAWEVSGGYVSNQWSGTEPPTNFKSYYHTGKNKIYATTNPAMLYSLPLMITTGAYEKVKHVFNAAGYHGNLIWLNKGIKMLIPNGINPDSTLNSIEHTSSTVLYRKISGNTSFANQFFYGTDNAFSYFQERYHFVAKDRAEARAIAEAYSDSAILIYIENENIYVVRSGANGLVERPYIAKLLSVKFDDSYNVTAFSLHKGNTRVATTDNVDGQWVYLPTSASYVKWSASGTKKIDLSSILPSDGYDYECLFGIDFYATNQISLSIGTDLATLDLNNPSWVYNQGSGKGSTGTTILAVGSGRYVQVNATAAPTGGTYHFAMRGYRRLGTNV